ncbi:coiled-coil domain-containing protein 137 isoform X2 [Crocuta crocuta]
MRSRQEMKNPISNKKRKKEAQVAFRKMLEKEAKGVEPDIAVPKFKQRKWESDRAYIQRMEQETQHVLFLSKNQAARQPEVQLAPKKEKSERKKASLASCEPGAVCVLLELAVRSGDRKTIPGNLSRAAPGAAEMPSTRDCSARPWRCGCTADTRGRSVRQRVGAPEVGARSAPPHCDNPDHLWTSSDVPWAHRCPHREPLTWNSGRLPLGALSGSSNGGWIKSGREGRKRPQKGSSRSCSETRCTSARSPCSPQS